MPKNGLISFCTFYKDMHLFDKSDTDENDFCFKQTSVLTKLRFKLKECVKDDSLVKKFDVTLYPNSLFLLPLSSNRLYTHEIIPSTLPVDKIPTRMGYIVRCSNTKARFINNQTYIETNGVYTPMEEINQDSFKELKELYIKENTTDEYIQYPEILYSMNLGDYKQPLI
jgi:hypothetical protein